MRILFISQMLAPDDPRRTAAWSTTTGEFAPFPDERLFIPSVFEGTGAEILVVDATTEALPDPRQFDGVVVGGSVGSANDREPWRVALENWLQTWTEVPLLGICGGHQLLARALGGEVAVMPSSQYGVFPLTLEEIPGFSGWVVQLHAETVVRYPEGAEVWASDPCGVQALRYGPNRWTFQFHPEISREVVVDAGKRLGIQEWPRLEEAISGGRALIRAWLAQLRTGVSSEGR